MVGVGRWEAEVNGQWKTDVNVFHKWGYVNEKKDGGRWHWEEEVLSRDYNKETYPKIRSSGAHEDGNEKQLDTDPCESSRRTLVNN